MVPAEVIDLLSEVAPTFEAFLRKIAREELEDVETQFSYGRWWKKQGSRTGTG